MRRKKYQMTNRLPTKPYWKINWMVVIDENEIVRNVSIFTHNSLNMYYSGICSDVCHRQSSFLATDWRHTSTCFFFKIQFFWTFKSNEQLFCVHVKRGIKKCSLVFSGTVYGWFRLIYVFCGMILYTWCSVLHGNFEYTFIWLQEQTETVWPVISGKFHKIVLL